MRGLASFLAFLVLLVAQWVCRDQILPRIKDTKEAITLDVAGPLFGGLKPLIISRLWWTLEEDYQEQLYGEVLVTLRLIQSIEPADNKAAYFLARFLAWDVASKEASELARLGRIEDGLSVLNATLATRVRRGYPEDPTLHLLKALILSRPELWTEGMSRAYQTRHGKRPPAEALDSLDHLEKISGPSNQVAYMRSYSLRMLAIQRWFGV
jgi:hypothetical protein